MLTTVRGRATPVSRMVATPAASGWREFFRWIVALSLAPWVFGDRQILGFGVTGWAWAMGGTVGAAVLALRAGQARGEWLVWAPWLLVLAVGWARSHEHPATEHTVLQTACPIIVGAAASTFRVSREDLTWTLGWMQWMPCVLWGLAATRFPDLLRGRVLEHGWLTPEMCGVALWASFYVGLAAAGEAKFLWHYASLVLLPIVFLVRGPTAAALLSLPLSPAPIGWNRRIVVITMTVAVALVVLSTERFQARMFHSGRGTLADVRLDNPDLSMTGRTAMWTTLLERAEHAPLFGHGVNASRTALANEGFRLTHPHNDWIKLFHDVGLVGIAAYGMGVVATLRLLLRRRDSLSRPELGLRWAAAAGFVPTVVLMVTDNVTLYVQYMGNVHLALIGGLLARDP